MLGKILSIASIGNALSGIGLTRRFVSNLIVVLALTIIAAMIAGALILCGFYECYVFLTHHGLNADDAILFTALLGFMFLGAVIAMIAYKVYQMREFQFRLSRAGYAGASTVQAIVRGFSKGMSEKT